MIVVASDMVVREPVEARVNVSTLPSVAMYLVPMLECRCQDVLAAYPLGW